MKAEQELPEVLPGHWSTPEGLEMAQRYAAMDRAQLGNAHRTDFEIANAVFMADRGDLDLIVHQMAAKERIRWLSAQLAVALSELASLRSEREGMREGLKPLGDLADKINPKAKDDDCWCGQDGVVIRYRHIRRARALLHQGETP